MREYQWIGKIIAVSNVFKEYHEISKDEYETVEHWIKDDHKVLEILRGPILCHGYKDSEYKDFDEKSGIISENDITARNE